jgi:hypothetical protein
VTDPQDSVLEASPPDQTIEQVMEQAEELIARLQAMLSEPPADSG